MPLRYKSIIIIAVTLFLLLFSILLTAESILSSGYNQLEKSYVERNIKRAVKAVENEVNALESMVKYWEQREDIYQFTQTLNPDYLAENFEDLTFVSQRLNVVMCTDLNGRILYIRAYDWDNRQEIELSPETAAKLAAVKPLRNRTAYNGINKGILTLPKGQMLVAAGAITRSPASSEATGIILIGRYIDYVEKEGISERVQLPLDFTGWTGELPPDFAAVQPYLSYYEEMVVKPVDTNYIAGYTVLSDIYGEPALFMRILVPRIISQQAQEILNYFIAMLLLAGLGFGGVMLALLEWHVLARLTRIIKSVKAITKSKDLAIRLPALGRDELGDLASNINNMLGSLAAAQARLSYVGRHDTLTGLYNRASFEEYMEAAKDTGDSVQIIMVDVDGLKLINDTLGHTSGDKLLCKAAEVLRQSCPEGAVIARFGGDEFAVLLKNYSAETVAALCQGIKAATAAASLDTPGITLSMSLGFAAGTGPEHDVAELLREADNYMYRDKLLHNRSTRSAIVHTLKKALEARDFITDGHADRLQDLVRLIGTELGLPEAKLAELQLFAQFHDIGKVGIPDGILFKPDRLTDDEMAVMRTHSEIGYRIARSAPDLIFIADWVLKHHEWYNGGGYPLGVKGDDIPLECRILALADAYDAMTSQRPYRLPIAKAEAIAELKKNAGVQFDPELTQVFIKILGKLP